MGVKFKYKPFPKITNPATGKKIADIPKLKKMYLEGPEMTWKKFCERSGFNPKCDSKGWVSQINLNEWKREWIKNQCDQQDEDIVETLLDARRLVAKNRAHFVTDWNNRAKVMKQMLDFLSTKHINDMRWDTEHTLEIQAGRAKPRTNLTPDEMATLAATAQRLQDLEAKSLLLMPVQIKQLESGKDEIGNTADDEIPEFEFHTMGTSGMKGSEITQLMAGYFDQYEKPKELEVKADEPKKTDQS